MKTGKVAKLFEIDPKTVTGWVDEFEEFFSEKAKRAEGMQRDYLHEDLIVLNTIKVERIKRSEPEQIRAVLASGHRETALPPQAAIVGGDTAIAIYSQMKELEIKLEEANTEIQRLRQLAENERQLAKAERQRADERIEAERQRADEQIQLAQQRANDQILTERKAMQTERTQLNDEIQAQRAQINEQIRIEREANQAKIEQLIRDAAIWQTRYEILQEQLGEENDDE